MEKFKRDMADLWNEKWEFFFCLAIVNAIVYFGFKFTFGL